MIVENTLLVMKINLDMQENTSLNRRVLFCFVFNTEVKLYLAKLIEYIHTDFISFNKSLLKMVHQIFLEG